MPPMSPSVTGIVSTALPVSSKSKVWVRSIPLREITARPWASENGDWTRTSAVSPGCQLSPSGIRVSCSSATLRLWGRVPPETHRVSSVRLSRPSSSVTVAEIRYRPPTEGVNSQPTGPSAEVTPHDSSGTGISTQLPPSNLHSRRVVATSTSRPATRVPSRSVTITSIVKGSPASTKVRGPRRPTYRSAGWIRALVEPEIGCRLTSITVALADTVTGCGLPCVVTVSARSWRPASSVVLL